VGKYIVFVEMNRRSTVPERIIELLKDLKTLTSLKLTDWTVQVNDEDYEPDEDVLKQVIICNPSKYKSEIESEEDLNEMREIAGLKSVTIYTEQDNEIKNFKSMAGL